MSKQTKNEPILLGPKPLSRGAQKLCAAMGQAIGFWQAVLPDQQIHALWRPSFCNSRIAAATIIENFGAHLVTARKADKIADELDMQSNLVMRYRYDTKVLLCCTGCPIWHKGPSIKLTLDKPINNLKYHAIDRSFRGFYLGKFYFVDFLRHLFHHPPKTDKPSEKIPLLMAYIVHRCAIAGDQTAAEKKWCEYRTTIQHYLLFEMLAAGCTQNGPLEIDDCFRPITQALAMADLAEKLHASPQQRQGLWKYAKQHDAISDITKNFAEMVVKFKTAVPRVDRQQFISDWLEQAGGDYASTQHTIELTRDELHKTPAITELVAEPAPIMSLVRFVGAQINQAPNAYLPKLLDGIIAKIMRGLEETDYNADSYVDGFLRKVHKDGIAAALGQKQVAR